MKVGEDVDMQGVAGEVYVKTEKGIGCEEESCTDPLHILPSLSGQTNATSDGVCNFSNIVVEEGIAEMDEVFMSINEEMYRGTKEEEIPGDIIIPDINSERDEVSYICMSVIGHILRVSGNRSFFVMSVFIVN